MVSYLKIPVYRSNLSETITTHKIVTAYHRKVIIAPTLWAYHRTHQQNIRVKRPQHTGEQIL